MSGIRSPWRLVAALFLGSAVLLSGAGCSSATRDSAASKSAGGAADAPAAQPQEPTVIEKPGSAATQKPGAPAPGQPALTQDRSIIFNGTVNVRVRNVDQAAAEVSAHAVAAGGFVSNDNRSRDGDRSQARMTLRVPSERFNAVVDWIAGRGEEKDRELSTQDVTEQVVDLEARISTAQASVDRVRSLLARAQTISEIVSLESEVSRREADLESLKSRKRKLDDLSALSTITAVLLGPAAAREAAEPPQTGFLVGLTAGWRSFVGSLQVLLTVLGALLPWLIALGVPALVAFWAARRFRSRRVVPVRSEPTPASSPAD